MTDNQQQDEHEEKHEKPNGAVVAMTMVVSTCISVTAIVATIVFCGWLWKLVF